MMSDVFTIGSLSAASGSKVQGWLPIEGSSLSLPLTLVNGSKPGKTVVISAGIHGGEYPGIEAAVRLARTIDPEQVSGRIVILPCANQEAFFSKSQYVNPIDGKNLNRVFPGKVKGSISERIAYTISSELFPVADCYLDLHSGDIHEHLANFVIYPQIGTPEQIATSREIASLLGVTYVVASTSATGTFGSAAELGIPGFLGEVGCCGRWSEDDVRIYLEGIKNVLRFFAIIPGVTIAHACSFYKRAATVSSTKQGLWHPAVVPEQLVHEGDLLGQIVDLFGEPLESYYAPCLGPVLYVASSLAITIGDPLAAVGEPE